MFESLAILHEIVIECCALKMLCLSFPVGFCQVLQLVWALELLQKWPRRASGTMELQVIWMTLYLQCLLDWRWMNWWLRLKWGEVTGQVWIPSVFLLSQLSGNVPGPIKMLVQYCLDCTVFFYRWLKHYLLFKTSIFVFDLKWIIDLKKARFQICPDASQRLENSRLMSFACWCRFALSSS